MTSDSGNSYEDSPRREATNTSREATDPRRETTDPRREARGPAAETGERAAPPGTPADSASYDRGEGPRRPADSTASREASPREASLRETAEPARTGQRDTAPRASGNGNGSGRGSGNGDAALLTHDECDKYALRLQHAVGGFVDGPRASVEEADHVLEELTAEFTDAMARRRRTLRTTLEAADAGDSADTEKLRLALRDYREVAERLLHL